LVAASAFADDVFMVHLARPTVETIATNHALSRETPVVSAEDGGSFATLAIPTGRHPKRLHVVGTALTAAAPPRTGLPLTIVSASDTQPTTPPAAAPADTENTNLVNGSTLSDAANTPAEPPIQTPAFSTTPPLGSPTAPAVTAAEMPTDAPTPAAKPVEASAQSQAASGSITSASIATTVPAPTPSRAVSVPGTAAIAVKSSEPALNAINSDPINTGTVAPINSNSVTSAVTSAFAALPPAVGVTPDAMPAHAAATQAPPAAAVTASAPVEPPAPIEAIKPVLTTQMVADALKAEIDAHVALKPAEERKLSTEERKTHAGIVAFYAARNYAPLWVDAKGLTAKAESAIDRLAHAGDDGLRPSDYPAPTLAGEPTAETFVKAELQLTETVLKYARQAEAGRFDPAKLGENVTPKLTYPEPEAVLKTVAAASNVSEALEAYNPPQEGFKRLKAQLAAIERGKPLEALARVPAGPTIRPGAKDTRVALLRDRLGVTGDATADDASVYDDDLVDAVKSFQKKIGLKPSGLVGSQTVDAINDASPGNDTRAADIIANMERWRWLPRNLGDLYVFVNIPDFALTVVRDGVVTHRTKAIVGRVANPTPVFSDTMTHIIVNPYWNVPYSIIKKEYLGKAQETNGEALERGNFEVSVNDHTVDPTTVDWSTISPGQVHLRQRPGEGNALGNIKFMFPNAHSVYIHDTSSRGLFVQSYRSLSHGCVRVQDPFSFADALLAEEPTALTGSKLKATIGGDETYFWLKKTIPVHLAYFTDFVDDSGKLQTRPDLYGINAETKKYLGL
jgi:murein L,D-transpeptidase YcbB/YkuD